MKTERTLPYCGDAVGPMVVIVAVVAVVGNITKPPEDHAGLT